MMQTTLSSVILPYAMSFISMEIVHVEDIYHDTCFSL